MWFHKQVVVSGLCELLEKPEFLASSAVKFYGAWNNNMEKLDVTEPS